ncbi:MAG: translation initiation factor IF-2 [Planctomycetota bacterium]
MKSKAIVQKCEAEGIPSITNHMSSVSAGLEATIREWFSSAGESGAATAVETAEKVDLTKVRAKPRKKAARKKAARKTDDQTSEVAEEATATAVAPPPPEAAAVEAPPIATPPPAPTPTVTAPAAPEPVVTEPPAPEAETEEETGQKAAASAPAAPEAPSADEPPSAPADPVIKGPSEVQMNVPTRPEVTKPAGPRLEVQKPAKLSGPKVVRIEQPEAVSRPRSRGTEPSFARGPRGGEPAGGPPTDEDFAPRSPRRNKRRGGGGEGGPSGPSGPGGGGRPGGGPGGRRGRTGGSGAFRTQDLIEREERLSRSGGLLRQRRRDQKIKSKSGHQKAATLAQTGGVVKVATPLTIKDLSSATGVKAAEIVKKLFMKGIMSNVNAGIEVEQAQEIMLDYEIELEVEEKATGEAAVVEEFEAREVVDQRPRSPVVTILGHVDHGKTSLLDRIRNANVAAGEAGGITQATSAFLVPVRVGDAEQQVCFLDTPGHEAFTEMRSRGATMTDIVVLVVAADDGVMPQTVESISHAKAAGVPIIVALNKIDLPDADSTANVQKIYGQLNEHGLNPTEWGGDIEVIKTSAQTGDGIQDLLEMLEYQADLKELKADFGGAARGIVVEARVVEGRGSVASVLVQEGELSVGDIIVAGRAFGRVRDMTDDKGKRIKSALPSTPVQISGLDSVPDAGDKFYVVKNLRQAQDAAEQRRDKEREEQLAQPKITLDRMFAAMEEAELKELLIVLKADVQGSVDAIRKSIEEIATDEVKIRVLHSAVGGVTESDVTLAAASDAVILGFNVIPSAKARQVAEQKGVEIRSYQVIYDIVDDVKKAAEGLLEPELRQEVLGHAEVRQVFKVSKVGWIAGCYVTDGSIERNALIRVTRDGIVIENDRVLDQLKRFKDDVKDVRSGQECGMKILGYDDIKEGDVLECYRTIEVKRTL